MNKNIIAMVSMMVAVTVMLGSVLAWIEYADWELSLRISDLQSELSEYKVRVSDIARSRDQIVEHIFIIKSELSELSLQIVRLEGEIKRSAERYPQNQNPDGPQR